MRDEIRIGLIVGVLGGFTTFSAFGLETFLMVQEGKLSWAILNVVLSCTLGAGRGVVRLPPRGIQLRTARNGALLTAELVAVDQAIRRADYPSLWHRQSWGAWQVALRPPGSRQITPASTPNRERSACLDLPEEFTARTALRGKLTKAGFPPKVRGNLTGNKLPRISLESLARQSPRPTWC